MTRRALGYARVSSVAQTLGSSLEDQQAAIRAHAARLGIGAVTMYVEAESAGHEAVERRHQMQALMREVRRGDLVICDKLDRWSRDPAFAHTSIRDILRRAYGTGPTAAFWRHRLISTGVIVAAVIGLLASLNVALFVFNLIPLMPLDGGHMIAAIYEAVRRKFAKLRGKADPGPVNAAKLMPLTYVVVAIFGTMSLLLIYADIVKPVKLFG
jgi:hypothetical protein